jgi:hypothetical protein
MALFTVTVSEKINQPPSQVGNGSVATAYGETYVFTVADFTTNTTPSYQDPEGDAAAQLRVVTSLPAEGELRFSGAPVSLNQVINFADIAAGLLTYVPNNATTSVYSDTFNFEIADAGSGQFVG